MFLPLFGGQVPKSSSHSDGCSVEVMTGRSWPIAGICCNYLNPSFDLHVVSDKDSFSARFRMSTIDQERKFNWLKPMSGEG